MSRISRGLGWGNKDKYEFSYIEKLSCIKDLHMQVCDLYDSWDVCVGSWIVRTLLVVVFVVVVVVPEVIRGCSRSGSSRRDFLLIYFIYPLINQANSH